MLSAATARVRGLNWDIKWVIIGVIIVYLMVFQVFPLLFLLYRAFFSEGYLSLDGFRRVYSHIFMIRGGCKLWLHYGKLQEKTM